MPFLCVYFPLKPWVIFFSELSGRILPWGVAGCPAWGRKEVAQIASAQRMKSVRDVHVVQAIKTGKVNIAWSQVDIVPSFEPPKKPMDKMKVKL